MAKLKEGPDTRQAHDDCCAGRDAVQGERLAEPEGRWVGGKEPRIELLYFEGCPTYKPVRQIIAEVLVATRVPGEVRMINVTSEVQARQLKFIGSPTVRIDGRDVDPSADGAQQYGLKCRIYSIADKLSGCPSRGMILATLQEAGYVA